MAKAAVNQYVGQHPDDSKFPELKEIKHSDKSNVELDLGETADFRS